MNFEGPPSVDWAIKTYLFEHFSDGITDTHVNWAISKYWALHNAGIAVPPDSMYLFVLQEYRPNHLSVTQLARIEQILSSRNTNEA